MNSQLKLLLPLLFIAGNVCAQPWAQLVKDACPGACGVTAFHYTYNGRIYYLGYDEQHDIEPWVSDGTAAGTHLLKDINPDPQGESNPLGFAEAGGKLFFLARTVSLGMHKIFVTDGTEAGTISPRDVGYIDKLIPYHNEVYFTGVEGGNPPNQLWKSDGTTAGTIPLTNLPGNIAQSAICKNKLFLVVPEMTGWQWLWVTDGTISGTVQVSDKIAVFESIGVVNDKFCFHGYDNTSGTTGIFITDGTAQGTELLEQITDVKSRFAMLNNKLYYLGANGTTAPAELHVTDGTVAGTKLVKQLIVLNMQYEEPFVVNNRIIFSTTNGMWSTDGTATGTTLINTTMLSGAKPVVVNNKLFFTSGRNYLWTTDGTATGTQTVDTNVYIANNRNNGSGPRTFMVANGKVYCEGYEKVLINGRYRPGRSQFYAADANSIKLVTPAITTSSTMFDYAILNNELYLAADDSISGIELWKITDFPTAVQQAQQTQDAVSIYPNPATNTFSIKTSGAIIKIYSLTGQLMLETQEAQNINIAHLPSGIYMVQIINNGKTRVEKLVKE